MVDATRKPLVLWSFFVSFTLLSSSLVGQSFEEKLKRISDRYVEVVPAYLRTYCIECHSGRRIEGELDLSAFPTMAAVRKAPMQWVKVLEMLDSNQMPPQGSRQPLESERNRFLQWVRDYLALEAIAREGDPGPVLLRRLNNAEYTYTLRDLTGIEALDPVKEFPVDGAAGEGFTNTGYALSMSPALVTKYLDAAKRIAQHMVFLPRGIRFSPSTSRRDWTDESLKAIRNFYSRYSDSEGGQAVNLQGIQFDTNRGGRLPVERYLKALRDEKVMLRNGSESIPQLAEKHRLNARYLELLWKKLESQTEPGSILFRRLKSQWEEETSETDQPSHSAKRMYDEISAWQKKLWKFNTIGHIGKEYGRADGPQGWMEPLSPIVSKQEVRLKLPSSSKSSTPVEGIKLYLQVKDAGDGDESDFALWENPRLVSPGNFELSLRDLPQVHRKLESLRRSVFEETAKTLDVISKSMQRPEIDLDNLDSIERIANENGFHRQSLELWLNYLGMRGRSGPPQGTLLAKKTESVSGYDFIRGWVGENALSVLANASDQSVRIPGLMKPKSIAVHPSPNHSIAIGWSSPDNGIVALEVMIQHAHPECGNGIQWTVELRRGKTRRTIATGESKGPKEVPFAWKSGASLRKGDLLVLSIHPKGGNHSCDLTCVELKVSQGTQHWILSEDVAPDILESNPHPDQHGGKEIWSFFFEPTEGPRGHQVPMGSLLDKWQASDSEEERRTLSAALQSLLQHGRDSTSDQPTDRSLFLELTSFTGPFFAASLKEYSSKLDDADIALKNPGTIPNGLELQAAFGKHPNGSSIDPKDLCVRAPSTLEFLIPSDFAADAEFVSTGSLHRPTGIEGSLQFHVDTKRGEDDSTDPALPIVVSEKSEKRAKIGSEMEEYRNLFPIALCYTKIVPVDEVVTLTLFFREDEHLQRLMLGSSERFELNQLWDELLFVSQEPLLLATAFEQIYEFATQDRPDMVKAFEPMRGPINARAEAFRVRLKESESSQRNSLIAMAPKVFRRRSNDQQVASLNQLYQSLRNQELPHEDALRLTFAKMLTSPEFLYRLESSPAGEKSQYLSGEEIANRLSYFLWSSMPDEELMRAARDGKLNQPQGILEQTHRMLRDPKAKRMAAEFAAQWLHIYDFANHNEKSETLFPTFASLRSDMSEESTLFFWEILKQNRSFLDLIDADFTFVNDRLAEHYRIDGVVGSAWRRVDGVRQLGRGGILTQSSVLSTQSGASRTSPILRGNWLSEVVLGERLPKPPKDVPQLPDRVPPETSERQWIEQHSQDPACAKCHARIDPFGFALENYDAIGRFRKTDLHGKAIDSVSHLQDGTSLDGLQGLKAYLLTNRRTAIVRQFHRKLLGYALGRSMILSDEPLLQEMRDTAEAHDHRIWSAIEKVVLSKQFRMIRGADLHE